MVLMSRGVISPPPVKLWVKEHSLEYLPIPSYVGSGGHTHLGTEYRFMVMQRFGEDIERKFESAGRHFGLKTVCYLALRMVSRFSTVLRLLGPLSLLPVRPLLPATPLSWRHWNSCTKLTMFMRT